MLLLCALAGLAGCGDDDSGEGARAQADAQVYASVVEWFAEQEPAPQDDDELIAVFLDGLDDDLPIEVQVDVLDLLDDELDVRFIDDDEEAIDEDLDGAPVRKDGILLRMGPIVGRDGRREIDVERYEGAGEVSRHRVVVESSDDGWGVVGEPEALPVPDEASD